MIDKDSTEVYAEGFGDSSVNLVVWFWIEYPGNETGYMAARHKAVVTVKRELEKADILIPFPIRTLEFNAKGGTKLESIVSERFDAKQSEDKKDTRETSPASHENTKKRQSSEIESHNENDASDDGDGSV